eukprot:31557-Pelagococcus_subviridis.AAC.2
MPGELIFVCEPGSGHLFSFFGQKLHGHLILVLGIIRLVVVVEIEAEIVVRGGLDFRRPFLIACRARSFTLRFCLLHWDWRLHDVPCERRVIEELFAFDDARSAPDSRVADATRSREYFQHV